MSNNFLTPSLAEVYIEQGHYRKALEIYKEIYEGKHDDAILERIDYLESMIKENGESAMEENSVDKFLKGSKEIFENNDTEDPGLIDEEMLKDEDVFDEIFSDEDLESLNIVDEVLNGQHEDEDITSEEFDIAKALDQGKVEEENPETEIELGITEEDINGSLEEQEPDIKEEILMDGVISPDLVDEITGIKEFEGETEQEDTVPILSSEEEDSIDAMSEIEELIAEDDKPEISEEIVGEVEADEINVSNEDEYGFGEIEEDELQQEKEVSGDSIDLSSQPLGQPAPVSNIEIVSSIFSQLMNQVGLDDFAEVYRNNIDLNKKLSDLNGSDLISLIDGIKAAGIVQDKKPVDEYNKSEPELVAAGEPQTDAEEIGFDDMIEENAESELDDIGGSLVSVTEEDSEIMQRLEEELSDFKDFLDDLK